MDSPKILALRAGIVLTLLASMPLLVLPCVVAQIDAAFYAADPALLPLGPQERPSPSLAHVGAAQDHPNLGERGQPAGNETDELDHRIQQAQARLQQLGASYMVLEAAGAEERVFHFHCRMPVGESLAYCQPFDATGSDPAATMEQVVAAVEAWRRPAHEVQTAERPSQWR